MKTPKRRPERPSLGRFSSGRHSGFASRFARRGNVTCIRVLLAAAVVAATAVAVSIVTGNALALGEVRWSSPPDPTSVALERRVSLPRETTAQRYDLLRRRTIEAGAHRRTRSAAAPVYRFMVAVQPDEPSRSNRGLVR